MTESLTIILELPVKVLSPNHTIASLGGRFVKAAAIKKSRKRTCAAIQETRIETAPWRKVLVEATFYFATKRERDQDNAMGSLKSMYDGIVDSGLVLKDDYEHMKRGEPEFLHDKEFPRVEVTITNISSP